MKRICKKCKCKFQRKFLIDTYADNLCQDCNAGFLQALEDLDSTAKNVVWLSYVKKKGFATIEDETWLKPEQIKAILKRFEDKTFYYSKLLKEARATLREIKSVKYYEAASNL